VVSGKVIGSDFLAGALYTSNDEVELLISLGATGTRTGGCVAHPAVAMTTTNNSVTERASLMRQIPAPFE
jgi:hypothetical protein